MFSVFFAFLIMFIYFQLHAFIVTTKQKSTNSIDITESLLADNRVLHSYSKLDKAKMTSQEQIVEHLYSSWKGDSIYKQSSKALNITRSPFAGLFSQIVEKDLIPSISTVSFLSFLFSSVGIVLFHSVSQHFKSILFENFLL
jgi:hypothetical protein